MTNHDNETKVFLYFLVFMADDLSVFYDTDGIAAVSYHGNYEFLQDTDSIRHCFEEGYIDRSGEVGYVLYAYTEDKALARSFEKTRDMSLFIKKSIWMSEEGLANLYRFKEAKLELEDVRCARNRYIPIVLTAFESDKVFNVDEEYLISTWGDATDVFEFLPLYNGYGFNDDCFTDSLMDALRALKFRYFLGEEERPPIDQGAEINEWNVFYFYFNDTLRE